jgi:hypothetical protein
MVQLVLAPSAKTHAKPTAKEDYIQFKKILTTIGK